MAIAGRSSNYKGAISIERIPARLRSTAALSRCQRMASSPCKATAERSSLMSQDGYDVYVKELKPLQEGEKKHVISIFVADEAGLINRVAGVFGRRGANIESLAVGVTVDKALFTIVVTGRESTVANLVKQLSKLVKVRYVEDITNTTRVEREMLIIKVRVQDAADRTEALQLAQIYRARIVDNSDETLTLCVTGDPGKCAAVQRTMQKFGILEISRTGRICLKRGPGLLDSSIYIPSSNQVALSKSAIASPQPPSSPESIAPDGEREADVYSDGGDEPGIWSVSVQDILDPTYDSARQPGDFEAHTLSIEVQDVPGVLNQVTGVFARRGYSIQSLAVGPSEREGMSRICMVVPGTDEMIAKLFKQLSKLVYVQNMVNLTRTPFVNRELMLVKVACSAQQRAELNTLAQIFRATIIDVSPVCVTFEILGKEEKLKALTDLLEPYGIMEIARTGRVAVIRESGVNTQMLERYMATRVF